MADETILDQPVAANLSGTEAIWIVQGGTDRRTTTGAIAGLANGFPASGPLIVATATPLLPAARVLTGTSGLVAVTDGGPGGTIVISIPSQVANKILAGPTSGGAADPTFRSIVAADLPASVPLAVTNDTNVTGSITGQTLTLGWTGTAAVARGGTGGGAASGTLLDNITGFAATGVLVRTAAGTYAFRTLTGTANRLTVTNGDGVAGAPTLDISATYVGQASITTLGTIAAGAWNGTAVGAQWGGTGLATLTAHAVMLGNGTGNVGFSTIGTAGRVLTDRGAGADPAFTAPAPVSPQGRLTLTSGVAVPTSDVAAATTVYYTPATGRSVPIWNGSIYVNTDTGGELSQATTDATKSPAAVANNSNYDVFVWSDGGTIRATRGPAWTSDTARGTGAGTTELLLQNGIYVNKNAITNGPGANLGTYVGTFRSNGTATADLTFGSGAIGGGASLLNVWNAYNQVWMRAYVSDTTSSWTYAANTVRSLNASNGNRVSFVSGLAQHAVSATLTVHVIFAAAAAAFYGPGLGLDSTTAYNFLGQFSNAAATANVKMVPPIMGTYVPQLGFHYIQALEFGDGTNTNTLDQSRVGNGAGLQILMLM